MMAKTARKQVAELAKAPKIKPNLRPIFPIIFAAKIVKIAVPTTAKAVGNVDKDFIEVICDPTIPLKKTVIILAVYPKTWLKVNSKRFLFIKIYIYHLDKQTYLKQNLIKYKTTYNYLIFIFSGIIPFGRYLIINNSPIPIIKNLKYGTLSIK